ncbi:sulfate permease, partial [Aureobasidium melanogenum]
LDFSSVNNVDVTSVQHLIDVRNQLDRYTNPEKVQWHFAHINNRWTRRALAAAGFGYPTEEGDEYQRWKPIFSVAELGGSSSAAADAEYEINHAEHKKHRDLEIGRSQSREVNGESSETSSDINQTIQNSKAYGAQASQKKIVVHGLNRPFFHIDLTSALQSAIANIHDPAATADVVQDKIH